MFDDRERIAAMERVEAQRRKMRRFRRVFRWYIWGGIAVNLFATMAFLMYGRVPWMNAFGFVLMVAVLIHNEVMMERLR